MGWKFFEEGATFTPGATSIPDSRVRRQDVSIFKFNKDETEAWNIYSSMTTGPRYG